MLALEEQTATATSSN